MRVKRIASLSYQNLLTLLSVLDPYVLCNLIKPIMLMVQKQTMSLIYYQAGRQIYVQKTWWRFAIKGFLSMMITIQHQRISHNRVRILTAQVIGGERVLFAPGKLAIFKIILLISDIVRMMPSFVCHFFSCSWLCSQRTILRKSSLPIPTRV